LKAFIQNVFCYELFIRNINYQQQQQVPMIYESIIIDEGLRLDLLIEDLINN
jgi:hypothetical protein